MTQPAPDRLAGSLARIDGALNPRRAFTMVWEYTVISATPGPPVTIDCEALDLEVVAVLPAQLPGLVLWPGPSSFVALPPVGSIVRVAFVNGDPSKPIVVGLDPNATPVLAMGFVSGFMQLGDTTASAAAKAQALIALITALETFVSGLNPTTLAAQATALGVALAALPPSSATKVLVT